jgi:hypothetical protein
MPSILVEGPKEIFSLLLQIVTLRSSSIHTTVVPYCIGHSMVVRIHGTQSLVVCQREGYEV